MHTRRHKKGNAAKAKQKEKKQNVKLWIHGTGVNKVLEV